MEKLSGLFPKSHIGRGILALAGGTAVAQLITAGAMPVVTRLYSPAQIGVISLFIAFFGFWSPLLSWRYESALLVAANDEESHFVHKVGIACVVLTSLLSAPVLYGLVHGGILGFSLIPAWSALAGVPIFLGYGLFMMDRAWGLRSRFVGDISKATMARSASNAVTRIVLGVIGAGIPGLFAAELAGAWGARGALRRAIKRQYSSSRPTIKWQGMLVAARRYAKFAKYEMPSVAIDQLAITIPVPMVAALYGAQAAGWFGLARILVALPNAQVGRAVADVFQMELARTVREGQHQAARHLFYKLLGKLSIFGLLPLAGTILLGPWLAPWIFGKPWAEMGIIAAWISPWLYAALVVNSLSRLLSVLERQEYKLIYDISALLLIALVYGVARYWSFTLIQTIALLTCANVVGYVIYLLVLLHVVSRDLRVRV
jgi:O-antigen/teichoic acid export membrane protein